ncbi:MAG: hypothetical protein HLUCCA08_15490 [Rhodobacteraceae bacterium HLUCCA08]|nr:MAG: hypothetical protein HLUCCA08_15490 [Rhodobacteraceae bacterium HLUCCA08]
MTGLPWALPWPDLAFGCAVQAVPRSHKSLRRVDQPPARASGVHGLLPGSGPGDVIRDGDVGSVRGAPVWLERPTSDRTDGARLVRRNLLGDRLPGMGIGMQK